ncbi:carboxyl transferase domain-containing protein [Rhodococcus cercidiphylli]|uniref:Acetyl-coenzyme A carboxylase carboxyl transferase subunits beta/alpha n=1 Tax=Rhodococcus cercidiphylli TaxID=489916 RepID=A0ABU4AWG0_9NOCA|nr:carboxyl transferase domain-containing protein [Rhodococcus cercidiphylli]MDV6230555.1 carboxyl transferase domain-containing protein [Rhodococcus cercidiphylli]
MTASVIGTPDGVDETATHFADEWDLDLVSTDPLGFAGYTPPAIESVRSGTVRAPDGTGEHVFIDCDFARHGGTMGAVAGERIVRAVRRATDRALPVAFRVSSGGARLQEGMFALVQMARVTSALVEHRRAGLMTAAALRHPTTGGVYASWASGADVRIAAPGAVIGFGGPRVVEQVTGVRPPASSHTAESAYANGLLDALVPEPEQPARLRAVLGLAAADPLTLPAGRGGPRTAAASPVSSDAWDVAGFARSPRRASGLEWAAWLTDSWIELHGTDPAIRAGIATVDGVRVVLIAMDRVPGAGLGLPGPAAFRLAQRAISLADRLHLPVVTLVDTPGADPSPDAEADGIAHEISATMAAMAALSSVSVSIVVGEGGSGGAMALAHADHVAMLRHSVFWVIGPEAGSAVLYRDPSRAAGLARAFAPTAAELVGSGFAERALPESITGVRRYILDSIARNDAGHRTSRWNAMTERAYRGAGPNS